MELQGTLRAARVGVVQREEIGFDTVGGLEFCFDEGFCGAGDDDAKVSWEMGWMSYGW